MPLHDWSRVPAGLFHHFHQHWSVEIAASLNRGRLPNGIAALIEERSSPRESDVFAIESESIATKQIYATWANRIVLKHHLGRTIAVIEIVSPGNKDSRAALRDFVDKTIDFLRAGIHVLMIDPFPPTARDPLGIHKVIWDEIEEKDFALPEGKDRILASYETGNVKACYVEAVGVGDVLVDMPLFLATNWHIPVPLEPTYQSTWSACPEELRLAVETGIVPEPDDA